MSQAKKIVFLLAGALIVGTIFGFFGYYIGNNHKEEAVRAVSTSLSSCISNAKYDRLTSENKIAELDRELSTYAKERPSRYISISQSLQIRNLFAISNVKRVALFYDDTDVNSQLIATKLQDAWVKTGAEVQMVRQPYNKKGINFIIPPSQKLLDDITAIKNYIVEQNIDQSTVSVYDKDTLGIMVTVGSDKSNFAPK